MTGFDLPAECPECGNSSGWVIEGEHRIFVDSNGEVELGRNNGSRYGDKFQAICGHRDCDATCRIYIEAKVVNNSQPESTGAKNLIEKLDAISEIPETVRRECEECGDDYVADVSPAISQKGSLVLRASQVCQKHGSAHVFLENIMEIPPEDIEQYQDVIPEKNMEKEVQTE